MCLNPLEIVNPTKYVSLHHRDRYLMQVPCGHCAECQRQKSNEWYFRAYWQSREIFDKYPNSFIIFDTLTYSPRHLPMMSHFMPVGSLDYPCFNPKHLRDFVKALRQKVNRGYGANFSYFITSEYGTSEHHTHRPHYHALFYVIGDITPSQFSRLVAQYWKYGRTDGLPYKSEAYLRRNTFTSASADNLRTVRYVSKYVQKSCKFQSEINRRISAVMFNIAEKMPDNWIDSVNAQRVRAKLKRLCNQFHRQSTQFGSYALECLDMENLYETGSLFMPDSKSVVLPIGLPTYYKRKLFYQVVKIDGNDTWIPTPDGELWLAHRESLNLKQLTDRFTANMTWTRTNSVTPSTLADYVLNRRGRINASNPPSSILERAAAPSLYNYVTMSDKEHLGSRGLTRRFLGNNTIGYRDSYIRRRIKIADFIEKMCYFDSACETALTEIAAHTSKVDAWKQSAYELRQRLTNLYHYLTT